MKFAYRIIFANVLPLRVIAADLSSAIKAAQTKAGVTADPVSTNLEGPVDAEA